MKKAAVLALIATLLTIGVPLFIAKSFQLGGYAKSPQTANLRIGQRALVGGGRAKLCCLGGETGADFELENSKGSHYFRPELGKTYEACGVKVELLGIEQTNGPRSPKVKYRITWEEAPR